MGKQSLKRCVGQCEIEAILIDRAREGKIVVRLKGGDPFVFGRGGEEALALRNAGISFEIVPGVSSAISVAAYAGIPVTHRGLASSLAIVTGHDPEKINWRALVSAAETIVILMGLGNIRTIMERLEAGGCDPNMPVALIQSGTHVSQRDFEATVRTAADQAWRERFRLNDHRRRRGGEARRLAGLVSELTCRRSRGFQAIPSNNQRGAAISCGLNDRQTVP